MMNCKFMSFLFLLAGVVACTTELPDEVAEAYQNLPEEVDFNLHVKPILSDKCFQCHGPDKAKQKGGLRLDIPESAFAELSESPGKQAIKPGNLEKSELFHRILSNDPEMIMPNKESNLELTAHEKAVLIKWIQDGAEYKPHWSFIKPEKPDLPKTGNEEWVNNPVDRFVLKKLETENLKPSPKADMEILLRRLSFDLTGLPPTPKEVHSFLSDESEDAYEKVVDRLLASPHYGEKMAMDWMDLSRYADTHGYSVDRYRDMSPWRDWVIKAFNVNMAYDQFVTWQLAGDLLPNPTKEQILATAFNRLHPQNMEGGIIQEEFRVEYVLDRTNTVGKAFMALTVECSRCHDHKYDPISQKEYFEMTSFFNNVNEAGQISWDDAMPVPTMLWTTGKKDELLSFLKATVSAKENDIKDILNNETDPFIKWLDHESYSTIGNHTYPRGIQAHFTFENSKLENKINPTQRGQMKRMASDDERPLFDKGKNGRGLKFNGDAWFDCGSVGVFKRSHPFTIGVFVNIPEEVESGVIFHKGIGAALYNFRGYHLALKNNRLELVMAHTTPDNAIIEYGPDIPRNKWIQLTMTYDGSSRASGFKVYLNGTEVETSVEVDNLYKDIDFDQLSDEKQPGLQIGARWRGKGIANAVVDEVMSFDRVLSPLEVLMIGNPGSLNKMVQKSRSDLSSSEIDQLRTYYIFNHSKSYRKIAREVEEVRTAYADSLEEVPEVMIMKEMPEPRQAYLLERGLYDAPAEKVFPNTPESILSMPDDLPKNRLGFAKWLLHRDHPLTARVTVNRYWQNYFGRGLVRTTEDFGNQGEMPSHPKLLDWLAVEFMESGWDVKALQKLIVMSATYQQDSRTSNHLREVDSENVLLARGPAARLTGEMIRDNALAASGLLNTRIGGKSVKPYQPDGLWRVNGLSYEPDKGDKLYRRSLYTIWKRSVPHPTLATFDTPERSECTVRRQKTNTPLQALVMLNDPTFIECAKVMGEAIAEANNMEEGVRAAFLKLTGRNPGEEEMQILLELRKKELEKFKKNPKKAKGWLSAGEYLVNSALDPNEVAANAIVVSTILNADVTITKR